MLRSSFLFFVDLARQYFVFVKIDMCIAHAAPIYLSIFIFVYLRHFEMIVVCVASARGLLGA